MHWAAFGFCLGGEFMALSQCTVAVVVARGLVERACTRLRLVIT